MKISDFFHLINHRWYIQEVNATPALLDIGGLSAIHACKNTLGYHYTHFIETYAMDEGKAYYDRDELHYIADEFMKRYKEDPNYLLELIGINKKQARPH